MTRIRKKKKRPAKRAKKQRTPPTRLEKATIAYFSSMSKEELEEENRLGDTMAHCAGQVNFDED
jgi:hypothetical protein